MKGRCGGGKAGRGRGERGKERGKAGRKEAREGGRRVEKRQEREEGRRGGRKEERGRFTEYTLPPEPGVASVDADSMHPGPVHIVLTGTHDFDGFAYRWGLVKLVVLFVIRSGAENGGERSCICCKLLRNRDANRCAKLLSKWLKAIRYFLVLDGGEGRRRMEGRRKG